MAGSALPGRTAAATLLGGAVRARAACPPPRSALWLPGRLAGNAGCCWLLLALGTLGLRPPMEPSWVCHRSLLMGLLLACCCKLLVDGSLCLRLAVIVRFTTRR